MSRAVLSLGSNLGDRLGHLRGAVHGLRDVLVATSGVYETPPWGDADQPAYLNLALLVADPAAAPRDWLVRAQSLEAAAGRRRDPDRRFGPRTLDVDVIGVWNADGEPVVSDDPELVLPHPRAHLRAFVLRPWLEIEPSGRLPGHGRIADLLSGEALASQLRDLRPDPDMRIESDR
ncbi:2-amino-4-hydroxy-6-hydroxymethyldihydropteridine diphosphokinase [Plantactinospora sp. KBS50]|uniref:2-amino-4-hydroxy-6- hydroxymethyldihydropteridine diphosphokinase n=1 Tax=Plantactinospora sp. KBS50 TaxID=2024580 RepID=UPI000BAAD1C3|nr:2-amino-4-hydroxy-6-hydroxymethyldihydropteridine diphosphokinase [Plantactinospora sp. KBS50]ASW57020.1 2-amino-4-hydroxy-6-hydroxymethyldihydropteridine diphosphokinase [Plantactinospora sp. KBS50]